MQQSITTGVRALFTAAAAPLRIARNPRAARGAGLTWALRVVFRLRRGQER